METAWLNRRRSQDTWSRQICPTETNVNHGYITNASFRWRHPKRQLTLFLFFFSFYRTTTKSPKFKLDWQCNYWCKTADFQRDTKCDPALLFFFILFSLHCIRATVISDIYEYGGRKWDNKWVPGNLRLINMRTDIGCFIFYELLCTRIDWYWIWYRYTSKILLW